ncbi:NAD(P)H nitroreductase [Amycolatopsis sp. FBCC-B4732]|uniref:NAD(P)H nitroreductase n=1 Tax=Amycolatopsis sp. FBCC-B4732 TaxID=3079339 RepID=UPI001FF1C4E9|nr:NAD(P)H nitroreductase [Amycolatopsis sp. FBCC-B4732]UOX90590.1 NAD(P)H nitroreductase [Amycolatopsis sp. FBCC-B4732]
MNRRIPDTATIEAAVALALRAPSAGNSQPWCWRIGYSSVHLFTDQERRQPDPGDRDLLLGCGAALHHVRVGFAALGWRTEVSRLPDPGDPAHLAVVTPHPAGPSEETVALAAAIPRRRSDRGRHGVWPVPRDHLARLAHVAACEGAELGQIADTARGLRRAAVAAGSRDRPGTLLTRPLASGGELLVLSTAADGRVDRLRAGEAASAVLLTATALGLSSCPLTDPLKNPELRRAALAFAAPGQHPQILLRVGWAPPGTEPPPPTPRRPLGHVLEPLQAPPKYHHRLPALGVDPSTTASAAD